jgi:hypothetical protein
MIDLSEADVRSVDQCNQRVRERLVFRISS